MPKRLIEHKNEAMRSLKLIPLLCCCLALLSCANAQRSEEASVSKNTAESLYSSEMFSSEEAISSKEESALPSESIGEKIHTASWVLRSADLEETAQSQYLNDYGFSIEDSTGDAVFFYGDYLQQGKGDFEGTIQFKKGGNGKLECHSLLDGVVILDVYKRISYFDSQDHDYTGVPQFFVSEDLVTWDALEGTMEEGTSNNRLYSFKVSKTYFKFVTNAENALYLNSVSFGVD